MNHRTGADPPTRIVWQRVHQPGAEWCSVERGSNSSTIAGVAVLAHQGGAQRFDYELELDAAAATRRAQITAVLPERTEVFDIATDAAGSWWRSGKLVLEDPDAFDVDLGFSPVTNSLPIWRLGLRVGECREITALWLQYPELRLVPARQTYERLGDLSYRYASGSFEAVIRVFPDGLVEDYVGYWKAITRS
ncbi:MAG TPA: putative glycolipid-binding domain-containing protein [Candidatus Limnocylindrales bacterium]|jgi:uncharacterized protein